MSQLLHTLIRVYVRKSSDDDDDDGCSGKNKHSAECLKPTSDSALTIGLAVGLPVAAVLIVLGYFLFRNYRKARKEDQEHDPDFDENGEATVLPDFPAGYSAKYEDPFDNRNSLRFPPNHYNKTDGNRSSSASITPSSKEGYIESFVLPYHHQTGSKVSLDEYARQLGEFNPAYGSNPRVSSYVGHSRTRNSSSSNFHYLNPPVNNKNASTSPQKSSTSNLKHEQVPEDNDLSSQIEEISNDSGSLGGKPEAPQFGIDYENESDLHVNNELNPEVNQSTETFNTTTDHLVSNNQSTDRFHNSMDNFNNTTDQLVVNETPEESYSHDYAQPISTADRSANNESPFSDDAEIEAPEAPILDEEPVDGDFDFSNESANVSAVNTVGKDEQNTANTSASNLEVAQAEEHTGARKSPRISAFNLLKNNSDDEEDYDEDKPLDNGQLEPEQEEELKRMKSIYKLYFDRENSVKRKEASNEYENNYEFKADPEQPLPEVNVDQYLKINNKLTSDTDYNKRLTTTSSIYTDTGNTQREVEVPFENQQQMYNYYLQDPGFQQFYHEHVQESLPPLQQLKNPSDIRQSTIQTYTDYRPRNKAAASATSPTAVKQPFNPIENDGVWTSPRNSPNMANQQGTFNPQQQQSSKMSPSLPSATQLARSSVVMLNPVTEITKLRKFKPAGGYPNAPHGNNHAYAQYSQQSAGNYQQPVYHQASPNLTYQQSSDSLIPGGKKSDVRKLMNSNGL